MDFSSVWPRLSDDSQAWLSDHNGEPLAASVKSDIFAVSQGEPIAHWWAGESPDGESELADDVIDWIEAVTNNEN